MNVLIKKLSKISENGNSCFKIIIPKVLFNKGLVQQKQYLYDVYFDEETKILSYVPVMEKIENRN